uniref:RING-type E3 ubiquitin transferase n=1 Tax=Anthurium amnicola TaxID=1678845 RepID=A0A1D1XQH8_9ARAE
MGAFCCCPCGEEFEEYTHPSSCIYRHCICLRHFFHRLLNGNGSMFQRIDGRNVTLSNQGGTPLASTGLSTGSDEGSLSETYHLVARPTSYETDPRYSRTQRDGLVSRHEKSLSHIQEGSQAIKRSSSSSGTLHVGAAKKQDITDIEEESKAAHPESEKIFLSGKAAYGIDYMLTSEDEDVCPTCLEEYTSDNPKILTQCSHHFHLSCIYEWMERSENCPLCGKEMEFCESP